MRVETYDRLDEAARALGGNRTARFLGGGTYVMRAVNEGDQSFDTIVRSRDPSLRAIRPEGDGLTLGAGVTMAEIAAHRDLAFLAPVARLVGGPAVRNMATVGGNLFARHPYGDLTVALLALGATVTLVGTGGGRPVPIDDILRDRDRHASGLVAAVAIPRPRDPSAFRFAKVSRVKPKGIALLTIAAHLPASAGRLRGVRVAYGGMAPHPSRAQGVERTLEGQALDPQTIEAAARAAADGFDPPTDALASGWYRREVIGTHLRRLLERSR
jgi:CO/xanthine dehydrogenase FAD-binding subunit